MRVKILMVDLIYKRVAELHEFLEKFLTAIEELHKSREYEKYVDFLWKYCYCYVTTLEDLKIVSPGLYGIAPTIETIFEMEDEEEKKEELRKIIPLVQEEVERLWNNIEEIIIDSYEDVLRDATDSDEVVQAYRREVEESIIPELEELEDKYKRKMTKREKMEKLSFMLSISIAFLFEEIEKLVMGG